MKRYILTLFLVFLFQNMGYSQTIIFSKDSLSIKGDGFHGDIKDSLFITNSGTNELTIDSIYTNKIYLYPVEVCMKDTSYFFNIIFDQQITPLILSPQDSLKLYFYLPDLCPICANYVFTAFEDTLYFRSNALNDSTYLIYVGGQVTTDMEDNPVFPNEYSLEQNYPNPFNPATNIEFSIPEQQYVEINVFNLLGEKIKVLLNEFVPGGNHKVKFNGEGYSSGLYFYEIKTEKYSEVRKMLLLK